MSRDNNKLTFREIQESDVAEIVDLMKNSNLKFFSGGKTFESHFKKLKQRIFDKQNDKHRKFYKLVALLDGEIVGYCSLRVASWSDLRGDLGYFIADQFAGRGFATEAGLMTIKFAFENLGLRRLSAKIADENLGARRVAEKIGMKRESVLEDYKFKNGRWHNYFLYVILNKKD